MIGINYTNRVNDEVIEEEKTFKTIEEARVFLLENGFKGFPYGFGKVLKDKPMGNERYIDANIIFIADETDN